MLYNVYPQFLASLQPISFVDSDHYAFTTWTKYKPQRISEATLHQRHRSPQGAPPPISGCIKIQNVQGNGLKYSVYYNVCKSNGLALSHFPNIKLWLSTKNSAVCHHFPHTCRAFVNQISTQFHSSMRPFFHCSWVKSPFSMVKSACLMVKATRFSFRNSRCFFSAAKWHRSQVSTAILRTG